LLTYVSTSAAPAPGRSPPGKAQHARPATTVGCARAQRAAPSPGSRCAPARLATVVNAEAQYSRISGLIAEELPEDNPTAGTVGALRRLCRTMVRVLPASGAAISLMDQAGSAGMAAASDPTSELVGELQFSLGEGPCLDAVANRRPVLVPDLARESAARWPGYVSAAWGYRVRAVFAFPLQVGAARLGALEVYRDQPGSLSTTALTDAFTFARIATDVLLEGQRQAGKGETPAGLEAAMETHLEVHQAQGMVMIQLGVSLAEALSRLRGYAYAQDRRLAEVARDIVARRLILERDQP
jgi:hypothetical protein